MFAASLKKLRAALLLAIAFVTVLGAMPAQAAAPVVRTTYIVTVEEGSNSEVRDMISRIGEAPHDELTEVLNGFILDMTDTEVAALGTDTNVVRIEADAPMSLLDTQNPTPSWGLDRIDQTNTTYDNSYTYPSTAGAGVNIYMVDTGIMANNPDFAGRVQTGVDMLGQNLQGADCNGHGTHTAGTAAGTTYGVAKKATIIPVRVLSCSGSGSWSYFISGLDWIAKNNPAGTPAVMSASLGGNRLQSVNDAIENLYAAGITPIVAAGNSNDDACNYSPASAPHAITVGATDSTDARAYYSNYGSCVDVFAPGSDIVSDNYLDPTTPVAHSGTSMATPHVAGLAALFLANNPTATPAQVTAAIQAGALTGVVTNSLTTNPLFINDGFIKASLPPVGAPSGVTVSGLTTTGATVTWLAPVGTAAAKSYNVEYKTSTATTWTSVNTMATTLTLTGLTANTNYSVRVSSVDGTTVSAPSAETMFVTKGLAPTAPANLHTTAVFGDQVTVAWDAPNANGSPITKYNVYLISGSTTSAAKVTSSPTYTFTGLAPQTSYSFRVEAVNANGTSPVSTVATFSTSAVTPAQVGRVTFSNITATTATATWAAVSPVTSGTPITYVVNTYVFTMAGYIARTTYTVTQPTVALTGLTRYSTQLIYVTAMSGNVAGPISLGYSFNTLQSVPGVPSSFTSVRNGATTTLNWLAPSDSGGSAITGFVLEKQSGTSWVAVATGDSTFQTYVVATPAKGVTDVYRVYATNALGAGAAKVLNVVNQITAPGAPQTVTGTLGTDGQSVVLTWAAPADNGGSAFTGYRVLYGSLSTSVNTVVSNLGAGQLTVTLPLANKGVASYFAIQAINGVGVGTASTPVSVTRAATVPGAPAAIAAAWNSDGTLRLGWAAPADNGGSTITGYTVQRLESGTWVNKYTGLATMTNFAREAAGTVWQYRLIATNAVGSSVPGNTVTVQVPVALATAPQNFTAVDTGAAVALSFAAPTNLGGGTLSYYNILSSRDGGNTWQNIANTQSNSLTVARPAKGQTWLYKVAAVNQAGVGAYTAAISITVATTVPGAVSTTALFANDGSINLAWYLPSGDTGGLALTGYKVEKSYDNTNWTQVVITPANQTTLNIQRENPGVRAYFRVAAINSLGNGTANPTSIQIPYLKASAPQNVVITNSGTAVVATYTAPANLGGSTSVSYYLQVSKDGGTSWATANASNALTVSTALPAKGTTWLYRMAAYTSYGYSDYSAATSITVAATAPGTPSVKTFALNSDKSMTLTWAPSSDNGGSPVTGFLLSTSVDNVNYSAPTSIAANVTSLVLPATEPGGRTYVHLYAINAIGTSASTAAYNVLNPYLQATAVNGLTTSVTNNQLTATWAAPSNLGGAASATYQIFTSLDGVNFTQRSTTSLLSIGLGTQVHGSTVYVRVNAVTPFGAGVSSQVTAVIPTTVTSVVSVYAARANAATVYVSFAAPGDLGGLSAWGYKVQVLQNGTYVTIAAGVGTATNSVALALPQLTNSTAAGYSIRVVTTNAAGDSNPSNVVSVR